MNWKRILFNQRGSAITTTIFLLFGMAAIAFIGIEIVTSGLESYRAQGSSSKAYYGAETGIERALMIFNLDQERLYTECANDEYIQFADNSLATSTCTGFIEYDGVKYYVGEDIENAEYWVKIGFENSAYDDSSDKLRQVVLTAFGSYLNTNRSIETRFCIPTCVDGADTDGCGGNCSVSL